MRELSDYQREIEKNYEPKTWQRIPHIPPGSESLSPFELSYFCNSDSERFRDFLIRQRGEKATLLDYEILNLGYDPICGSAIMKSPGGKLILTIFSGPKAEDMHHYIEV